MPAMKAAVTARAGWAEWIANKLVLTLYAMLPVSLFGSRMESVVLGEFAVVLFLSVAVLCRLNGNYRPLKWASLAVGMTVLLLPVR